MAKKLLDFDKIGSLHKALIIYLLIRDLNVGLTESIPSNAACLFRAAIKELNKELNSLGYPPFKIIEWDKALDVPKLTQVTDLRDIKKFYESFDYDLSKVKHLFWK